MAPTMAKSTKKSLIVTLRISSNALSQLSLSSSSTPSQVDGKKSDSDSAPQADEEDGIEKSAEDTSTVQANGEAGTQEKKKRPQPSGRKRAPPSIDPNAPMRERARPGPKKKPRLADGSIDRQVSGSVAPAAATTTVPAHKLGPKANTGAINAGLRALDRSGKPCRRWEKKGLVLKSFTGMSWNMSSWKGSARPGLTSDGEVKSDSSSDVKPLDASAVPSEKSAGIDGGDTTIMNGIESSPAPAIAA